MIYLCFDTNIWLYLSDCLWKEKSPFFYLNFLVREGYVKIVILKEILKEIEVHKKTVAEDNLKKLKDFFEMADNILPTSFYSDYKSPENLEIILKEHLANLEMIISKCDPIKTNTGIRNKVIEFGIEKKKPFGPKKNSTADAVIVLSFIDFARKNPGNEYYFVSNDSDIIDKNNRAFQPDIEDEKKDIKIFVFSNLEHLLYSLEQSFSFPKMQISENEFKPLKQRIKEKVYNPEYEKLVADKSTSFIKNTEFLKQVLHMETPSKELVMFSLSLLDSETEYEKEFYKNVESVYWFDILLKKGVFNADKNPALIKTQDDFQVPYWHALVYLKRISEYIKEGKHNNFSHNLISIISDISVSPVDNYKTWVMLIEILCNLPNDQIPEEIFHFIPVWLTSKFDTNNQSYQIADELLPKFLSDNPTEGDVQKAVIILKHILTIDFSHVETDKNEAKATRSITYYSKFHSYLLTENIASDSVVQKISKYCSEEILYFVADNIKKLRYNFPYGIPVSLNIQECEYSIKAEIIGENLKLSCFRQNQNVPFIEDMMQNFENVSLKQTKEKILSLFKSSEIEYDETDENEESFKLFFNMLFNGTYYYSERRIISEIEENILYGNQIEGANALMFKNLLSDIVDSKRENWFDYLKLFALSAKYRLSFFRRVALYSIQRNWDVKSRKVFMKMISNKDENRLFSNYIFEKDLYSLLSSIKHEFNKDEKKKIKEIIEAGPQMHLTIEAKQYIDHWKLRWYSAFQGVKEFDKQYKLLSSQLGTTYNEKNDEDISAKIGFDSPITNEQLLNMSNSEIVDVLSSYSNKDFWEEPSTDGLSEALEAAVTQNPKKFANELELYQGVYYIYAYRIFHGFREAIRQNKKFDISKVLEFSYNYSTQEGFIEEALKIKNDKWNATSEWVVGAICSLLLEAFQKEESFLTNKNLSTIKKLLLNFTFYISEIYPQHELQGEYTSHVLNTSHGKTIRVIIEYSLFRARKLKNREQPLKWERSIKNAYHTILEKQVIDSFICFGWYIRQLNYLDQKWVNNQLKLIALSPNNKTSRAFLGGYTLYNPLTDMDTFRTLLPLYQKAIEDKANFKENDYGILRHVTYYSIWEYDDYKKGMMQGILLDINQDTAIRLINYLRGTIKIMPDLIIEQSAKLKEIALYVWQKLIERFNNNANKKEDQHVISALGYLISFISELNEHTTSLIKAVSSSSMNFLDSTKLIEGLLNLSRFGIKEDNAKNIGEILISFPKGFYYAEIITGKFRNLIVFLYENHQKEIANQICEKIAQEGCDFLNDIYLKYNK